MQVSGSGENYTLEPAEGLAHRNGNGMITVPYGHTGSPIEMSSL